jgi:hypothetical protein
MRKETADLVSTLGTGATAGRYGEEVKDQRAAADRWRQIAVVFAVLAVLVGLMTAIWEHQDTENLIGKLAVGVAFGAVAGYAAKQSGRHRDREERARHRQLELRAFGPFIEQLDPELKQAERVRMSQATFGQPHGDAGEDEGPSVLNQVLGLFRGRREEQQPGG